MKPQHLLDLLGRMPMLKVAAPFAAGVALAGAADLPLWFLAVAFATAGVAALLFRSSSATLVLLLTAGFAAAQLRRAEPTVPRQVRTAFEIAVDGIPADRGAYCSVDGIVTAWRNPCGGTWHAAADRILLRVDSAVGLQAGERIRCTGTVRPFRGGSESYRALMIRRGFAGTFRLSERGLLEREAGRTNTLHTAASARLARLGVEGDAGAVVRAMTAGDRSGITPELRAVYARSGFSHLLAVSGLHTGIVFLLINAALWWMPLLRRGHLLRNVAATAAIWLFVAAAGFPPSAVRAAVMCSLVQFTLAAGSEYSGLNGLAMAAFGMLLWNPAWLGDISFQLSFLAVAAILAWGVPLCRRLHTRRRAVNFAVDALAVSLAATAGTLPLVAHTFGIIPLAGIVLNPVAILLATVVVFSGALWMVIPLSFLALPFRFVAGTSAEALNALTRWTASLPAGSVDHTLGAGTTAAIYLLFAAATLVFWSAEPKKSVHLRK